MYMITFGENCFDIIIEHHIKSTFLQKTKQNKTKQNKIKQNKTKQKQKTNKNKNKNKKTRQNKNKTKQVKNKIAKNVVTVFFLGGQKCAIVRFIAYFVSNRYFLVKIQQLKKNTGIIHCLKTWISPLWKKNKIECQLIWISKKRVNIN